MHLVQQVFESTTYGSNQDLVHFLLNMTQLVHVPPAHTHKNMCRHMTQLAHVPPAHSQYMCRRMTQVERKSCILSRSDFIALV